MDSYSPACDLLFVCREQTSHFPFIYQQRAVQREVYLKGLSLWPSCLFFSYCIRLRNILLLAHPIPNTYYPHLLFLSIALNRRAGVLASLFYILICPSQFVSDSPLPFQWLYLHSTHGLVYLHWSEKLRHSK